MAEDVYSEVTKTFSCCLLLRKLLLVQFDIAASIKLTLVIIRMKLVAAIVGGGVVRRKCSAGPVLRTAPVVLTTEPAIFSTDDKETKFWSELHNVSQILSERHHCSVNE